MLLTSISARIETSGLTWTSTTRSILMSMSTSTSEQPKRYFVFYAQTHSLSSGSAGIGSTKFVKLSKLPGSKSLLFLLYGQKEAAVRLLAQTPPLEAVTSRFGWHVRVSPSSRKLAEAICSTISQWLQRVKSILRSARSIL